MTGFELFRRDHPGNLVARVRQNGAWKVAARRAARMTGGDLSDQIAQAIYAIATLSEAHARGDAPDGAREALDYTAALHALLTEQHARH